MSLRHRHSVESAGARRRKRPRLREIPYNYTSFSDREIVIRLLGAPMWAAARRAARRAPHRPLGAHAVRSARRHLGGRAQSLPAGRPARQSAAPRAAGRGAAPPPGRDRQAARADAARTPTATPSVAQLLAAARAAVDRFERRVRRDRARCAQARCARSARHTRRDNIAFDGLARVSHVTDATDWRVEYPFVVLYPDTEDEVRGLVAGCIELGLTIIPRGGGTGYTGGAIPLDAALGGDQHREARAPLARSSASRCPGSREPVPTIDCGAGVVTRRVMEAAEARGPRVRGRSDLGRRLVHRRQRRDERRRQEGGAVGHGARQPRFVADGHARRASGSRSTRLDHNLGKIHDARGRDVRARAGSRADGKTRRARREMLDDPGRALPQGRPRQGRHRQVPRRPARACRRKAATASSPRARFILHRMPPAIRTVCLEFFGQVRDSAPAIVEIKRLPRRAVRGGAILRRARAPRRALREGGRLRDQGEAPRPAEDGAARRHRRRRRRRGGAGRLARSCASPTRAAAKASSRCRPKRARNSGSTARAPRRSPSTPTPSRSTRTW